MWSRVREHMSTRRGRAWDPPAAAGGHAQLAAGGHAQPAAGGHAQLPADQHARPAAAATEAAPAGDAPAPSWNDDTLVLPVLGDTDDVPALPAAEMPGQDAY